MSSQTEPKIAVVGDPHFGLRDSSPHYFQYQELFFKEVLVPECERQGVKTIVLLGDLFHSRQSVNVRLLHEVKKLFRFIRDRGFTVYSLLGNHDICFKNNYEINSAKMLMDDLIEWTNDDGYLIFDDTLLVDWRNTKEEYFQLFDKIKDETRNITNVLGHFEFRDFKQTRHSTVAHEEALRPREFFDYFPQKPEVFSGHLHLPQVAEGIVYVGVPYYQTWGEHGQELGFIIYDREKRTAEKIVNPYPLFVVLDVDEMKVDDSTEIENPGYRVDFRLVFKNSENAAKAALLAEKISAAGHGAVVLNQEVCRALEESDIRADDGMTMDQLIEKFFMESFEAPIEWTKDDRRAFFETFMSVYENVKTKIDNTEVL